MTSHRIRTRLATALVTALGVIAGHGLTDPATAATSALSTQVAAAVHYQTNGRVAAIVTIGDTVYVGGDFTCVRPVGVSATSDCATNPSNGQVPRARLAAFSRTTGDLLPWNPGANNSVYALAASADGRTIYVGGNFGNLGGTTRKHAAAVDAATGAVTGFVANTDYKVLAIAATATRVYLGGQFTAVNGASATRVAAVSPDNGALNTSWTASADGDVRVITLSPDGSSVYLGGAFAAVDGNTSQPRLAKLSATNAALQPWKSHPEYPLWTIMVTTSAVYVGGDGSGGHAGSYSTAGVRGWVTQTDGGVQSMALLNGMLYVGGHFDNVCVGDTAGLTTGFNCPSAQAVRHKLLAVDPTNGALDMSWNPGANSNLGVFALTASNGTLHVGGDFTLVGTGTFKQRSHQGYAQFN
jgi:hypothetical protein